MPNHTEMRLIKFDDASQYYQRAKNHLLENEAANCLLLAISLSLSNSDRQKQTYTALIEDRQQIIATALYIPPRKLLLSKTVDKSTVELIARNLAVEAKSMAGITAPKFEAEKFVGIWQDLTGDPVELEVNMQVQQLETTKQVKKAAGKERLATPQDIETLTSWIQEFAQEALNIRESKADSQRWVAKNLEKNSLFVWKDSKEIVSMAAYGGKTPNGIRIKSVYTPPQHRGKGYATSLVAVMSQILLRQHKYCFLFTDSANPTSNNIYRKIGYVPIADINDYSFYPS